MGFMEMKKLSLFSKGKMEKCVYSFMEDNRHDQELGHTLFNRPIINDVNNHQEYARNIKHSSWITR